MMEVERDFDQACDLGLSHDERKHRASEDINRRSKSKALEAKPYVSKFESAPSGACLTSSNTQYISNKSKVSFKFGQGKSKTISEDGRRRLQAQVWREKKRSKSFAEEKRSQTHELDTEAMAGKLDSLKVETGEDDDRDNAMAMEASDSLAEQVHLHRTKAGIFAMDVQPHAEDHLENLGEPVYRVEDFYKEEGWAQAVATSDLFNNLTLVVIALNALYLGYDADRNDKDLLIEADIGFVIGENVFCVFFTVELFIRFMAFERKLDCAKDDWFKFDTFLVGLMVFETWIMSLVAVLFPGQSLQKLPTAPLRLLRLLRLSRLVRIMRSMPELLTMVKGIRTASRAVASSFLMVMMLVYVFGIILLMSTAAIRLGDDPISEHLDDIFGSLSLCMWTLLMDGTFMDSAGTVMARLRDTDTFDGYLSVLIFLCFISLSALTVMNMLIGVLCEVVTAVGQHERDEADIRLVKRSILAELMAFDDDGDATISQDELQRVMRSKKAIKVLEALEVDMAALDEIHGLFFKEPGVKVPIQSIMETFLAYRGSQAPTVKHLVESLAFNRYCFEKKLQESTMEMTFTFARKLDTMQQVFHHALLASTKVIVTSNPDELILPDEEISGGGAKKAPYAGVSLLHEHRSADNQQDVQQDNQQNQLQLI